MGRAQDRELISSLFSTRKTGESGEIATAFPASQVVAVNHGASGAVGLTVAKLREAKRMLMAAEVDLETDPLYIPITSKQHDNLLAEIQVVSLDFNEKPVMMEGKVERFLGFNFKPIEMLTVDGSSYRRIPAYSKTGVCLAMWNDITTDISQRKDLEGLPMQVYVYGTFGATRIEDKKVIEIKCAEA